MNRLADRLLAPAPAERLGVLRILVLGYALVFLLARTPYLLSSSRLPEHRWEPVGVLAWLGAPPSVGLVQLAIVLAVVAGIAAVAGLGWRVSGPAFALLLLVLLTCANSWGDVLHIEHLVVLHVLVIGAFPAAAAWSLDSRGRPAAAPAWSYGLAVRLVSLVTVLAYFLAGWAKLRGVGLGWLDGESLRNWVAHDNLRKEVLGSLWSPLGGWMVSVAWVWPPIALLTLVVELGAPVVLFARRLRIWWAWSAWAFHLGVLAIMAIFFPYPLSGIAFASLFAVERWPSALRDSAARLPWWRSRSLAACRTSTSRSAPRVRSRPSCSTTRDDATR